MQAPGQSPESYYRNRVEDTHYDRIFIDYLGYRDVQADVIEEQLKSDYPGLALVGRSLDQSIVSDAWEAVLRTEPFITEPRFHSAPMLSEIRGCAVAIGRLDEQPIGSFKILGPANAIPQLTPDERSRGIITASAGNHAQGVALVCQRLGIKATVVMPRNTADVKIEATRSYGAHVEKEGETYTDAYQYSQFLQRKSRATYLPAFDSERIMTGNAVAALQALLMYPNMTHWYGPVGGGGWLGGTARLIKAVKPDVETVGVQLEGNDAMGQSLKHGRPVELEQVNMFSEGTAVKRVGDKTLQAFRQSVDRLLVVSQEQLMCGLVALREETGSFAEPAGALAVTGLLADRSLVNRPDAVAVAAVTGRNISAEKIRELESFATSVPRAAHELARAALQVA